MVRFRREAGRRASCALPFPAIGDARCGRLADRRPPLGAPVCPPAEAVVALEQVQVVAEPASSSARVIAALALPPVARFSAR